MAIKPQFRDWPEVIEDTEMAQELVGRLVDTSGGGWAYMNQEVIDSGELGLIFQSYGKNIALKAPDGRVFLDENYWNYSNTTGKYRNRFLDESIKETRRKIQSGEYVLINLN